MTSPDPTPGPSRRARGPRDPGDAWVYSATGQRYWGRFGAAGLLAHDPARGVLLQHRADWSHYGGTWGIPGGALHTGEDAIPGAFRESAEEAGVPAGALTTSFTSVLELGFWRYTTVVAKVRRPFEPVIADAESLELRWVPVAEVDALPLHPAFGASWPRLRDALPIEPVLIVDAANLVGSVPNGWWKDRAGATSKLLARLEAQALAGVPAQGIEVTGTQWFPELVLVVEGRARAIPEPAGGGAVRVVRASASGDEAIVEETARRVLAGQYVNVVTSDRALAEQVVSLGAHVRGVRWMRELVGYGA